MPYSLQHSAQMSASLIIDVFLLECFVLTSLLQSLYEVPGLEVLAEADMSVSRVESQL